MTDQAIYHERQTLCRCGLHALNNVLQGPMYTKASLEGICDELATRSASNGLMNWVWNAHKSPLGIGNYDVNALTLALHQKGYVMQWVDKRRPVDEKLVNLDRVEGLLCNVVLSTVWSSLWMSRHWFAIRKIRGVCYNLDSKLATPMPFHGDHECYQFLQELVNTGECELFVVLKESTTMEQTHLPGGNDDL
uniref:ubiquitinyl hydrolase 1 n=1 Tax=Peronospora matthiolae TaxID=2874970 RepID=A0AAV1UP77_9STRA